MKSCLVFALAAVAVCSAETYSTEFDNTDIAAVVADANSLKAWVNCFTGKGDCTPQTAHYKNDMPEALQQKCAKCTDAQKRIFKGFLVALKEQLPAENEEYRKKYDPENKYFPALEAAFGKA